MSKLKAIIIILVVLAIGTGVLYFLVGGKTPSGTPAVNLLPFGQAPGGTTVSSGNSNGSGNGTSTGTTSGGSSSGAFGNAGQSQASFFKISDAPVAGFVSFNSKNVPWVRYVDRATGHVRDVNLSTLERIEIYNNTNPKIYSAIFRPDGTGYVSRQLVDGSDTVLNNSITLIPPKANSTSTDGLYTAQNSVLPTNIGDLTTLADGSLLYTLADTGDLVANSFTGNKPRLVLNSNFSEWSLSPFGTGQTVVNTKPSASSVGYAYTLNLGTGVLTKILDPLIALSVRPSQDGKRLLYSYIDGAGQQILTAKNLSNGTSLKVSPNTLPEKCVWSKKIPGWLLCGAPENGLGENAPDEWYLGTAHYSDKVWRFNVDTDTAEILVDPSQDFGTSLDLINPQLSPNEDYLLFQNKNDYSLWVLKL